KFMCRTTSRQQIQTKHQQQEGGSFSIFVAFIHHDFRKLLFIFSGVQARPMPTVGVRLLE
ncbi:MAG TPA: hypothetical protein PLF42_07270, partial [Anaerolineales bacterium]|nr:hypothetical protein [Anaerolineales bacterium]